MQSKYNKANPMQYATVALLVLIIVLGGFFYPSAAKVAERVSVPDAQSVDLSGLQAQLDSICELTDGCQFFNVDKSEANVLKNVLDENEDDFVEKLSELVGIDEKFLDIKSIDIDDKQARAYSEKDKEDENYNVEVFFSVKYRDEDEADYHYAYILASAVLDEGSLDDYSLAEVDRLFEFN